MRERVGKSCGERSSSAQDLEIAVPPTERTNRTRDKICVQEHVEANLSDYLLSVGWACVLHNVSQSSRAQDLINALPELGILRRALPLPIQGRAKGGKDRYGRKPCLDIVTQVLLAGFISCSARLYSAQTSDPLKDRRKISTSAQNS